MTQEVRQQLMTLRVLWVAIASSTLAMAILLFVIPAPAERPPPLVTALFGTVALSVTVVSFLVPRLALRAALRGVTVSTREEEDPEALPGFGRKRRVAADPPRAALSVLRASQASFIVSLALSEAVSLFGFTLGFVGVPPLESLPFFVVSWVLFALRFPVLERVLRTFEHERGILLPRAAGR